MIPKLDISTYDMLRTRLRSPHSRGRNSHERSIAPYLHGKPHPRNQHENYYKMKEWEQREYGYIFKAFAMTTVFNYREARYRWAERNVPYEHRSKNEHDRGGLESIFFNMQCQIWDLEQKLKVHK